MPPKKQKQRPATQNSGPPPPKWPPLNPVSPVNDLQLQTLVPDQILTIANFFPAKLCKAYVDFLRTSVSLTTTPGNPKRGEAVRVNDRFQIQDASFAERLWVDSGLREIIRQEEAEVWGGEVVGLNPNIRVYRYQKDQFFDKHYDDSNQLILGDAAVKTTWTLLIYLTGVVDGIKGGETVFYTEGTKKKPSETVVADLVRGTALLHKHGQDCMLHEGRLVEEDGGVGKWVLRSDLCVRR